MSTHLRMVLPALLCLSSLTFSGCCSKKAIEPEAAVVEEEVVAVEEPLESAPVAEEAVAVMEGRTSVPMLPVYFDFDASGIKSDQDARIQVNADFLAKNPDVTIRIEGNCDPRGTNEYNMALGERRALSAKKYLTNIGIAEERMTTISYGEERPLLYGHDELSWAQNRRDDFVIVE
ncbi:MAG: peptidoglycan-associated lipoprotein [Deltaproteobacteria bacterium]|nr:MAG: peptidoglycan-associated lipoprotein [Deltaproteobacteria bacterium]